MALTKEQLDEALSLISGSREARDRTRCLFDGIDSSEKPKPAPSPQATSAERYPFVQMSPQAQAHIDENAKRALQIDAEVRQKLAEKYSFVRMPGQPNATAA